MLRIHKVTLSQRYYERGIQSPVAGSSAPGSTREDIAAPSKKFTRLKTTKGIEDSAVPTLSPRKLRFRAPAVLRGAIAVVRKHFGLDYDEARQLPVLELVEKKYGEDSEDRTLDIKKDIPDSLIQELGLTKKAPASPGLAKKIPASPSLTKKARSSTGLTKKATSSSGREEVSNLPLQGLSGASQALKDVLERNLEATADTAHHLGSFIDRLNAFVRQPEIDNKEEAVSLWKYHSRPSLPDEPKDSTIPTASLEVNEPGRSDVSPSARTETIARVFRKIWLNGPSETTPSPTQTLSPVVGVSERSDISQFARPEQPASIMNKSRPNTIAKPESKTQNPSLLPPIPALKTRGRGADSKTSEIKQVSAEELELTPLDITQQPVPTLAHDLQRVLFNPGVYQLQDPRSRVFNFDPYLQNIMPVADFNFKALKDYIVSSADTFLRRLAREHDAKYVGSSSSMTSVLTHFHYLISQWRPINVKNLSQGFTDPSKSFTLLNKSPSAIFLKYRNGSYAIDADKEFASSSVLMELGKSLEKFLTLPPENFERYRKTDEIGVSEAERNEPEAYHYTRHGDFLMRSQLDAHDPRLPGTGMFDLKTRAVVSIRMSPRDHDSGTGYQISDLYGDWKSYEREYFDMIRSAFLKYSLQVRMGRMDGIFVAYHNVERIFGFQYVSLPELDTALHSQTDTSLGDKEFKLSLKLWNEILDRATERFPEQSLRFHFETREAVVPFMYIFAEPVSNEEIESIQDKNQEAIEEYTRKLHNLDPTGASQQAAPEESSSAFVTEDTGPESSSVEVEEGGNISLERSVDSNAAGPGLEEPHQMSAAESGSLDHESTTSHALGESVEDSDPLVATDFEAFDSEPSAANTVAEELNPVLDIEEVDPEEVLSTTASTESELESSESFEASSDLANDDLQLNPITETEPTEETSSLESVSATISEVSDNEPSITEVPSLDSPGFEDDLKSAFVTDTELSQDATSSSSSPSSPTASAPDSTPSSTKPIFGMTLVIRNLVNSRPVERPQSLSPTDSWTLEYNLSELKDQQAHALYLACQRRRKKAQDFSAEDEAREAANADGADAWAANKYMRNIGQMVREGRARRNREIEEERKREERGEGIKVLYPDMIKREKDGVVVEEEDKGGEE